MDDICSTWFPPVLSLSYRHWFSPLSIMVIDVALRCINFFCSPYPHVPHISDYNWLICCCCRAIDRDNSWTTWEKTWEEIVPSTRSVQCCYYLYHYYYSYNTLLSSSSSFPASSCPRTIFPLSIRYIGRRWSRIVGTSREFTVNGFLLVRCFDCCCCCLAYLSYTHLLLCRARVFTINLIIMRPATLYVVRSRSTAWIH